MRRLSATAAQGLIKSVSLLLVGSAFLAPLVATSAHAETVEFKGWRFPVDKITQQQNGDLLIEVEGQSWIASSDRLSASVAEAYLAHPEFGRRMPWADYVGYVVQAVTINQPPGASATLQGVLQNDSLKDVEIELFAKQLSSGEGEGADQLVAALGAVVAQGRYRPSSICVASLQLDRKHRMLLGTQGALPQTMRDGCGFLAVDLSRKAVMSGDFLAAEDLLRGALEIYGAEANSGSTMRVAAERINNFSLAYSGADVSKFESAYTALAADPLMRDAITAALPNVIRFFGKRRLEAHDGEAVVRALALLPLQRRTPEDHQLMRAALEEVPASSIELLSEPRIQGVLWAYATKDPTIKSVYIGLLERAIEKISEGPDSSRGAVLLASIRELRPDPSSENDTLRFMLATAAGENGRWSDAEELMKGVKTKIPTRVRVVLYCKRHPLLVLVPGAILVGSSFLWLRARQRRMRGSDGVKGSARRIEDDPTAAQPADFSTDQATEFEQDKVESLHTLSKTMRETRNQEEFERLLRVFGLKANASMNEIKIAYRQAVKSCHPDLNPRGDKKTSDQFIELTRQYERLLVIFRERQREGTSSKVT